MKDVTYASSVTFNLKFREYSIITAATVSSVKKTFSKIIV